MTPEVHLHACTHMYTCTHTQRVLHPCAYTQSHFDELRHLPSPKSPGDLNTANVGPHLTSNKPERQSETGTRLPMTSKQARLLSLHWWLEKFLHRNHILPSLKNTGFFYPLPHFTLLWQTLFPLGKLTSLLPLDVQGGSPANFPSTWRTVLLPCP